MTEITQEKQFRDTLATAPRLDPIPRMVPREAAQENLTGAMITLAKQHDAIKAALDRLISDAVALRALM